MTSSTDRPTQSFKIDGRTFGYLLVLVLGLAGGGGLGTVATGSSTASKVQELSGEVKTMRAEIVAELKGLNTRLDAFDVRLHDLEKKASAHAEKDAHTGAKFQLLDLQRRVDALEAAGS